MKREQLEHIIRAAASITGDDEIIVIGSQAILAQLVSAPSQMLVSVEADVFPKNKPELADLIDGSIGEGSPFHETFGYYAQGVGPRTAVLPPGWEGRLVPIRNPNTRGATGWCLEIHDLLLAKCVAGREKDLLFLRLAAEHGLAREAVLLERLAALSVLEEQRSLIRTRIEAAFRSLD